MADPSAGTRAEDLPIESLFKGLNLPEVQLGQDTDGK